MKKRYLPLFIILSLVSCVQASNAITRQEVESIVGSFIRSGERNIPSLTSISLPNTSTIKTQPLDTNSNIPEDENLENDPYSYEIPKDVPNEQKSRVKVIEIPHFNSYSTNTQEVKTDPLCKNTIPTISQPNTEQPPQVQNSHGNNQSTSNTLNSKQEALQKPPKNQLTRQEVFLACLTKMGWANTLAMLKKLVIFEEYSNFSPVDFVRTNMNPAPQLDLFTPYNEVFPDKDIAKLKEWLKDCVKSVQLETELVVRGNTLHLLKRGVPSPSGLVQDMKTNNLPLFIVYYLHNQKKNMAAIVPAEQLWLARLSLSAIAQKTDGAEFVINGGFFGAARGLIIGVIRSNGRNSRKYFWPYRSGIAWNNNGEHKFFDGRFTKTICDNRAFDNFTEIFQAGPMLIFNGQTTHNTENLSSHILNRRHPRSFVAEQPDGTLVWGVVDGKNATHSVGMTINELRQFCKERNFVNALNLDGGGSSSIWWNGLSFSKPSNLYGAERKIPYAVVIYHENPEAICEPVEFTPQQNALVNQD